MLNETIYPSHLAPTVGGGGTVDYVGPHGHDFTADVEAREKAGTPGLYQTLRAALAFEVKAALGTDAIHAREQSHLARAFALWHEQPGIAVLGPPEAEARVGIVSFNVRDARVGMLHPKLVTVLLNDLFGVQSRAGCSCAGPYGHRLLGIGEAESERYRAVTRRGVHGVKPGWCRVGFHYTMDDAEADYVARAVAFVAAHGARFLPLYRFCVETGAWTPDAAAVADLIGRVPGATPDGEALAAPSFSLDAALTATPVADVTVSLEQRRARYAAAFAHAAALADALGVPYATQRLAGDLADVQFFALA